MAGQMEKWEKDERLCMFIFQTKHFISMPCSIVYRDIMYSSFEGRATTVA